MWTCVTALAEPHTLSRVRRSLRTVRLEANVAFLNHSYHFSPTSLHSAANAQRNGTAYRVEVYSHMSVTHDLFGTSIPLRSQALVCLLSSALSGPKLSELVVSYLSVSVRSSGVDTTGDGGLIYLKWQSSKWRSCWTCNLLTFALFYCSNRIAVRLDRYSSVRFIPCGQRPASRRETRAWMRQTYTLWQGT